MLWTRQQHQQYLDITINVFILIHLMFGCFWNLINPKFCNTSAKMYVSDGCELYYNIEATTNIVDVRDDKFIWHLLVVIYDCHCVLAHNRSFTSCCWCWLFKHNLWMMKHHLSNIIDQWLFRWLPIYWWMMMDDGSSLMSD